MPMRPYGAVPAGGFEPFSCRVRPSTGVTVRVLSVPLRSTTTVTGTPGWSLMALVRASTFPPMGLPSTDTTTSPGRMPAAAAGPGKPPTGLSPSIWTWCELGTPTNVRRTHSKTKANRKCTAEPATATPSRAWKGLSR